MFRLCLRPVLPWLRWPLVGCRSGGSASAATSRCYSSWFPGTLAPTWHRFSKTRCRMCRLWFARSRCVHSTCTVLSHACNAWRGTATPRSVLTALAKTVASVLEDAVSSVGQILSSCSFTLQDEVWSLATLPMHRYHAQIAECGYPRLSAARSGLLGSWNERVSPCCAGLLLQALGGDPSITRWPEK